MEKRTEEDRIVWFGEGEEILAEIDFPLDEKGRYEITHTFVDPRLRGQGVAAKLVQAVLEIAEKNDRLLTASCPYARAYLAKNPHPRYVPLDAPNPTL